MNRLNIDMDIFIYKRLFWYLHFQTQYKGVNKGVLDRFLAHSFTDDVYTQFQLKLAKVLG